MAHLLMNEIPFTTHHAQQLIQPEIPTAELLTNLPQDGKKSRRYKNSPFLYSDATYNVRDFISQEDNESLDESYGDGPSNEICAFKLDQRKIDELANDYSETCVSSSRESAIQKESCKETVKNDRTLSKNEDESQCKSKRKRKTRRKIPDGVIINLSNNVYGISRGDIKISIISKHNLVPEMKFVAVPRKQYSTWNCSPRKAMKKIIDNSILTVLCSENGNKVKKTRKRLTKRKYSNYSRKSMNNTLHKNANTTISASKKFKNTLNGQQMLHVKNNMQSLCTPHEILDSMQCCHHDNTVVDIDNVRYPILNTDETCVDTGKCTTNYCCSIFNDTHQEYHICDREDYNTDGSDFNAEMQADWMAECFYPECTRTKRCRCFYDSNECDSNINMQHDRCPLMSRTARLFENSALPKKHQREEVERLESDIALEFATEADEYSPDGVGRCTNCNGEKGSSTSTSRKLADEPSGNVTDLHDSRPVDASLCEIDTCSGKSGWRTTTTTTTTMVVEKDGDRSYKSDSLKAIDTWDIGAWRDNCIGRRCADCVVAKPSRSNQHPGEKGGSARGVDSKWKRDSIETDVQQSDYKWERRIATIDAGTRARVDFKGKRDSRYKSEETIPVQLRESAEIRKRKSLEMVEATSQTKSDNINADGKHHETSDYSLWTSLQMGKIWSQVHDACKNVVKLAATSVGRVVKDARKSERSQKNPVEVVDATLVESTSSCAGKICGETCRKNLMRSKSEEKTEVRQERTIGDVGKYHGDTKASMRKDSRTIAPTRHNMQKHAYQSARKEESGESCANYSEYERGKYRDIVEFQPRNETYSHDEDIHSQSRLSESFVYHEKFTYPELRNRGGSDDNRNFARGTVDDQSVQHTSEETTSVKCHPNSKTSVSDDRTSQETHVYYYEISVSGDQEAIRADMLPVVSENSSLHHKSQSTNVSERSESNRQVEPSATPEQTRSYEETEKMCEGICDETCESIDTTDTETERSFTSTNAVAAVSLTEADLTVPSLRYDSQEPIASTSKWETSPASPEISRKKRQCRYKSLFCASAMKFLRCRSSVDNKITSSGLKWSRRRDIRRKELSSTRATTTCDNGVKIMQIDPSTMQTDRESNKRRAYVNIQAPDAIVTRILSEFLLSGEKKKKVLMTIMLQSELDDKKETETQTSSSNITSRGINSYPDDPHDAITTSSKTVQCFACDKQKCYEIRQSDNSITLEEALIAEYPETSQLNDDDLATRKADVTIPP
ncbi:PREDICTED: uncharacterized protein LOC108754884 isoform X1 [Trachymyrmex septentrionalis]|uniref:uncharacterized protein LOC108754884 isoform X1 n=1 Tax=Trachymyrmex septentrionalis TaxID=34720 RepID=UPI00084F597B|nr:PREDICTED: uncharacterized protein LOC108754884 isoform X1 [Trachymyrmex septentrionalis]